jgi:hypothetical protein
MQYDNVDDIIEDLRSKWGSTGKGEKQPPEGYQEKPSKSQLFPTRGGATSLQPKATRTEEGVAIFRPVEYSVDPNAIYDRLRSGAYVPKFRDYKGEVGNEDRLAREQTTTEKWLNGLQKFVNKTGGYALDSVVGTVYGIFNGIAEGDFRGVWDNDFSNWIDDVNKSMDYQLPNYYTDEEKSMGFLESMTTANFWANDFLGGLAFVSGALLPEAAIALISGGSSVPISLAKMGFRSTAKAIGKKSLKESAELLSKKALTKIDDVTKFNKIETATDSYRALQRANFGKKTGDVLNTGRFLVQSSNFEAGMEARHNFHEAVDTFIAEFEEKNGRQPTYDELKGFTEDATSAANWVYTGNMAILSVSNAAMFGKTFNLFPGLSTRINNVGNNLIGLGVKRGKAGKMALQNSNRLQRLAGNTYKVLSKPAVEGLYEEGLQGVAGSTMQNYLEAKYNPDSEEVYGVWSAMTDAFAHQYGSKEGWKEMGIGMLIGFGAPMLQKQAPPGLFSNSYRSKRKSLQAGVDATNKTRSSILSRINDATALDNFAKKAKSKADNGQDVSVDNAIINAQYIKASENYRSNGQMKADFDAVVDNMELTSDQITEIGGVENVEVYKQSLKDGFRTDLKNHTFAKKSVASLGLDRTLKDTPGNIAEIGDAVYMSIMTGKGALERNRIIASQIDSLIGSDGVFNYLEHFNNLSKDSKEAYSELKKKKRQRKAAKDRAEKYGRELAGVSTNLKREFTDETKKNRFDEASAKRVKAQQEINRLDEEIGSLEVQIESTKEVSNMDISQTVSIDANTHNITEMVEQLDKLEDFAKSLKETGRTQDYEMLMGLTEDFKMNSDAHREMNNMVRKMYDTNFFSTKEGKGLKKMVTGKPYKLSEEFRKIIRENDAVIDKSLQMVGFRNTGKTAEELIEDLLGPNNEALSEREKYRLESIIRLQLGYQKLNNRLEEITGETRIPEAKKDGATSPLEGDTITLARRLNTDNQDLGSVEVLNKLINQIITELDRINLSVGRVNQDKIDSLKSQIEELESKKKDLLQKEKESLDSYTPLEEITEEEFKDFTDNKKVSQERLVDIANKVKKGEKLSKNEKDIRKANSEAIEKLLETESSKIESEINKLRDELDLTERSRAIKIVNSEDYKRLEELNKKKVEETLTEEETLELEELEEDIDQWITISGVVADGLRLSSLLEQRAVLKNTEVRPLENVGTVTSQESLDEVDIKDKTDKVYATIGQTYDSVIAVGSKMSDGSPAIEISGINPNQLAEELGFDIEFEVSEQNTILISPETQQRINSESPLSILPTNKNLTTNYSVVLKTTVDKDGNQATQPLVSRFVEEFGETMVPGEIYNTFEGEEVTLEVDASDDFNKKLIAKYKDAGKNKKKQEAALNEMRKRLVIRVKDPRGNFVSVLKSKRSKGAKDSGYDKLASVRDRIIANQEVLDDILSGGVVSGKDLGIEPITVKKIYPGHPNFNFTRNEDGTVSIDSKLLTPQDIEKIDDIGYIENGEPKTRQNRGDIDFTFLNKKLRDKSGRKFPFVVFNIGSRRVAYPVTITEEQLEGLDEFEAIYSARTNLVDKANALNKFMASRGVDIKQQGNAFIAIGKHNINDEFFSKKLAQLKSIQYFRSLESWTDNKSSLEGLLGSGVSIDINLSKPLHSPKMQLDFSNIEGEVTIEEDVKPKAKVSKTAGKGASKLSARIKNQKNKEC